MRRFDFARQRQYKDKSYPTYSSSGVGAPSLLLSSFSPHLSRICGQAMIQFVPLSTQAPEWDPSALIERLSQLQGEEENLDDIDAVRDNCYILMSIVLGTIYEFRSKFCMDDGHEMSEDSEIAFSPDSIYSGQLKHGQGWWVHPSRTPSQSQIRPA